MASKGQEDENKRIPMLWSQTDETGMTDGPAGSDKSIESEFPSVEEQQDDDTSIWNYYKRALRLRNENPEIARGKIRLVEPLCDGNQAAIIKTWEDSSVGIVYNTSDEEITVTLSGTELEEMKIRGYLTLNEEEIVLKDQTLTMPAQSICILKKNNR